MTFKQKTVWVIKGMGLWWGAGGLSGPGRRACAKALEVAENLTCLRNRGEKSD